MAGASERTTEHDKIRQWVEQRGGKPARVKGTGDAAGDDDVGMLRIDLPGYSGSESLEAITWDEFFEKFEENRLAFLYQEKTSDGERSSFNKLVRRE